MATLYFVVFNQAEVLDFSGPFDVFSMARIATKSNPYDMKILSWDGKPIRGIHGFTVVPDGSIADVSPGKDDIVFIPGGATDIITAIGAGDPAYPPAPGDPSALTPEEQADLVKECAAIVTWLQRDCQGAGLLATICVGAFFGARAGIFEGVMATTHHGFLDLLNKWIGSASALPCAQQAKIIDGARYVTNPNGAPLIMSSAGVSAGIDLAMFLLGQIMCPTAQRMTENLMEYNGTRNFAAVIPNLPPDLRFCGFRDYGAHQCACDTSGAGPA